MQTDLRRWLNAVQSTLTESIGRTLYHGTLRKFLPSILATGLWPALGDFTRQAYAESEEAGIDLDELVFAADKEGLRSCVSAIIGALEQAGIKDTVDNFFRYGAIVVIREGGDRMEHREDDNDEGHPQTVEPGNYYSHYRVQVDYALTGWRLRSFLRRHGEVVDRHGGDLDRRTAMALLIRSMTRDNPDRQAVVQHVRSLSNREITNQLHRYRMHELDAKAIRRLAGVASSLFGHPTTPHGAKPAAAEVRTASSHTRYNG